MFIIIESRAIPSINTPQRYKISSSSLQNNDEDDDDDISNNLHNFTSLNKMQRV